MGKVFARGVVLHIEYADEMGKRLRKSSGFKIGQEKHAEKLLSEVEALVEKRRLSNAPKSTKRQAETLASFAGKWIESRKGRVKSASGEETRLRLHVLPTLGAMALVEIKPRHIRDLIVDLRAADVLAPRTIRHVYGVLSNLLKYAVFEEVLDHSPCVLPKGILPPKVDKDPEWRAGAIYTRKEIIVLVSDKRIPVDRHIVYAIKGMAGLRHGEVAGLKWSNFKSTEEPLGQIVVARSYDNERTKTGVTRLVPVHPALASLLAEWKLSGWERLYGREPKSDDLIVPTRNLTMRDKKDAHEALKLDLDKLGFRQRRGHDFRRSFVTIAQVDGARRDILKDISHGASGDIVSMYTSFPWPTLCAEIAKMQFTLPKALVLGTVKSVCQNGGTLSGTVTKKALQPVEIARLTVVTPPRFELGTSA